VAQRCGEPAGLAPVQNDERERGMVVRLHQEIPQIRSPKVGGEIECWRRSSSWYLQSISAPHRSLAKRESTPNYYRSRILLLSVSS